jgi:hypothetical protein
MVRLNDAFDLVAESLRRAVANVLIVLAAQLGHAGIVRTLVVNYGADVETPDTTR